MFRKLLTAASLLLLTGSLSGCLAIVAATAVAGTVGYVMYDQNEAYQDFKADLDDTWEATVNALAELGHACPRTKWRNVTEGEIEDEDLWVRVALHAGRYCRVHVRVGTFDTADHRRQATLILNQVEYELAGPEVVVEVQETGE